MITRYELKKRVKRLHSSMEKKGINSFLISNPRNVEYLTGRDTGRILLTKDKDFLWVKELYLDIYSDLYSSSGYPFDVEVYEKNSIKRKIKRSRIRKLAVENLNFLDYDKLKKELGINLVVTDLVEKQRAIKSRYEIESLRRSAHIAMKGMKKALEVVREGVREMDALSEIEYEIRKRGSESPPFESGMLLASGKNSANIHARASWMRIKKGSLVVVDLGARYNGYFSDMTRTIEVGKINAEKRKIMEYVREIQDETIDRIEVGVKAEDIHNFVEREMEKRGYRFYHSTGHGIGLKVHELPNIGPESGDILKDGMVFTIEPGIYIPEKFGVRFEDMILLKRNRVEILTR